MFRVAIRIVSMSTLIPDDTSMMAGACSTPEPRFNRAYQHLPIIHSMAIFESHITIQNQQRKESTAKNWDSTKLLHQNLPVEKTAFL